jgi:phosphatidylethanolamine/phosphatidyl-N-methylethanolamine N-methyltransferase
LPEGNLLEIGVGNGAHFQLYKKHKIVGIDTSATMLEIARKKCCENIKVFKMDGKALLFYDEEFDYVVLSHVIAVVDDPEQLLAEVLRVLKPQGQVFILNHFTPNNWLRYVDSAFMTLSKIFHFKSVFYIDEITTIKKFRLLKEVHFGLASYFKLLIYQKK